MGTTICKGCGKVNPFVGIDGCHPGCGGTVAPAFYLIPDCDCEATRGFVPAHAGHYSASFSGNGGCGSLEVVQSSGRPRCRQCGEKIAKGSLAIKGCYDFAGQCNPWTMVDVYIHHRECNQNGLIYSEAKAMPL